METSIFRPKPVPMSLVGTLVDLELLNQLFGPKNGKMGRKMGKWAEKYRDPHYKLSQLLIEIQTSDMNQNVPKIHVYISAMNILEA